MGIPIGTNLNQGVYHPPKNPPAPPAPTYPSALAEHIAMQTGQMPEQVGYIPAGGQVMPGSDATTASYMLPAYAGVPGLINQYLRAEGSPLAGLGRVFTRKSRKYGIDPRLLVAIAGAETSLGKDPNAAPLSEHNVWGMGPGIRYKSWGQGADATARNLAENYFQEGRNTIPEISSKWAPVGAANDPNAVNKNWTGNVTSYMNALSKVVGRDAAMKLFPVLGKADWTSLGGVDAHMSRPLGNWQSDNAIDMGTKAGTPVYAPARGKLTGGFGFSDNGSTVWGNRLTLDPRAPGLPQWFMTHMSQLAPGLEAGDKVRRGELLGYVGDSGRFPVHLHFGQEFGNPETTVTENLYDPTSAVPAARQYSGNSFTQSASPGQQRAIATKNAQSADILGASIGSYAEIPFMGRRRKRKSSVEDLLENLANIQAGGMV